MNLVPYFLCGGMRSPLTFIRPCNQIIKFSSVTVAFKSPLTSVKPKLICETGVIPISRRLIIQQLCSANSFSTVIKKSKSRNMSPVQDIVDSPVVPSTSDLLDVRKDVKSVDVEVEAKPEDMEVENAPAPPKLYFVKLTEHASAPTKGSKYAAGYDLKSAYDAVIPKRGSALVKTDIQVQLPSGTYGRVAPRSGLALKNKIDVGAGVIDEDYRGNIGVILFNHADEDFIVSKGDRIAQLICEKICYPEAVEVESLEESERGAAGFGSTGGVKKMKMDESKEN